MIGRRSNTLTNRSIAAVRSELYAVHEIRKEAVLVHRVDAVRHRVVTVNEHVLAVGDVLEVHEELVAHLLALAVQTDAQLHIQAQVVGIGLAVGLVLLQHFPTGIGTRGFQVDRRVGPAAAGGELGIEGHEVALGFADTPLLADEGVGHVPILEGRAALHSVAARVARLEERHRTECIVALAQELLDGEFQPLVGPGAFAREIVPLCEDEVGAFVHRVVGTAVAVNRQVEQRLVVGFHLQPPVVTEAPVVGQYHMVALHEGEVAVGAHQVAIGIGREAHEDGHGHHLAVQAVGE